MGKKKMIIELEEVLGFFQEAPRRTKDFTERFGVSREFARKSINCLLEEGILGFRYVGRHELFYGLTPEFRLEER